MTDRGLRVRPPAFLGPYRPLPRPSRPRTLFSLELGGAPMAISVRVSGFAMEKQGQDNWCWAAVAVSVARKYNSASAWTQCRLATAFYAQHGHNKNCCSNGLDCSQPQALSQVFAITGNLAGQAMAHTVPFNDLVREIDAGRPVCVRIGWPTSPPSGHFIAITGYRVTESGGVFVEAQDPVNPPGSIKEMPFAVLVSDYGAATDDGAWTHTYLTRA